MEKFCEIIRIWIYLSGIRESFVLGDRLIGLVESKKGRRDIKAVVEEEVDMMKGPMMVSVWGPEMLSNAVRKAARGLGGGVNFVEEGQSHWRSWKRLLYLI